MRKSVTAALCAIFVASPLVVNGQMTKTPEVIEKISEFGANLSPEIAIKTFELYVPFHRSDDGSGVEVTPDVSYGPAERNVLDVFVPSSGGDDLSVLVFVHGGGFVGGDKSQDANVGRWFARNDTIVVTPNYRLAPNAKWPSGAQDLALTLKWVSDNIRSFGGNPDKIIIAGTSAGATHVADYTFNEELQIVDDGVIGAVLISPPSIDLDLLGPVIAAFSPYYGDIPDPSTQSVIGKLEGKNLPIMIAYAELDPEFIQNQVHRLIDGVKQRDGKLPIVASAVGHNHISITTHIGTPDESLAPDILEFIQYWAIQ